jgi:hypothetical protein
VYRHEFVIDYCTRTRVGYEGISFDDWLLLGTVATPLYDDKL